MNYYSPQGNIEVWDVKPEGYYTVEEWEALHPPTPPTLDEAKAAKIALFKSNRDTEEVEDIEYNGNLFDYDDKAQARINVAYQVLQTGAAQSIAWTTADNKNVDMTAADFAGLLGAVAMRSNTLHVKYRGLKEQVEACGTVEEVEAITW